MFNLYRHMGLIGSIAVLVGLFLPNRWLLMAGITAATCRYMLSIAKIEEWIEKQQEKK